jgi:uncharacterized OB-fold protein
MTERRLPEPSALTAPFWEAAARHVLVRPVCRSCGRSFFTPQAACTFCLSTDWSYEPSSGRGTVYSATLVHRPPFPDMDAPFRLAIVDLDEGWSMLTNLTADAGIGDRVHVQWLDVGDRVALPAFTPDDATA